MRSVVPLALLASPGPEVPAGAQRARLAPDGIGMLWIDADTHLRWRPTATAPSRDLGGGVTDVVFAGSAG
jgi:hypothetical protein